MTYAFDADVLIYATAPEHPSGRRVRALFNNAPAESPVGIGSTLLIPEVLTKPLRQGAHTELLELSALLGRLGLRPVDEAIARLAAALGASYRLKAADAVHLATAVSVGATRFITNNRKDFDTGITEIEIMYPEDLPDPT